MRGKDERKRTRAVDRGKGEKKETGKEVGSEGGRAGGRGLSYTRSRAFKTLVVEAGKVPRKLY